MVVDSIHGTAPLELLFTVAEELNLCICVHQPTNWPSVRFGRRSAPQIHLKLVHMIDCPISHLIACAPPPNRGNIPNLAWPSICACWVAGLPSGSYPHTAETDDGNDSCLIPDSEAKQRTMSMHLHSATHATTACCSTITKRMRSNDVTDLREVIKGVRAKKQKRGDLREIINKKRLEKDAQKAQAKMDATAEEKRRRIEEEGGLVRTHVTRWPTLSELESPETDSDSDCTCCISDADEDEVSCASASGEIDEAMERCLDAMSRWNMADVSAEELESECPICMEPFELCGDLVRLQCGHLTCRCCLEMWRHQCLAATLSGLLRELNTDPELLIKILPVDPCTCVVCRSPAYRSEWRQAYCSI